MTRPWRRRTPPSRRDRQRGVNASPKADGGGPPELWVGAECIIHRIGDRWRDQSALTGFAHRPGDVARLASLGATKVRLPVLWERAAWRSRRDLDFAWADAAMAEAREVGLQPIVGLLHHGSGPRHTSLVDPLFPGLFADYARQVAERYRHAAVDADQRAAHDGALLVPVRALVSARQG